MIVAFWGVFNKRNKLSGLNILLLKLILIYSWIFHIFFKISNNINLVVYLLSGIAFILYFLLLLSLNFYFYSSMAHFFLYYSTLAITPKTYYKFINFLAISNYRPAYLLNIKHKMVSKTYSQIFNFLRY